MSPMLDYYGGVVPAINCLPSLTEVELIVLALVASSDNPGVSYMKRKREDMC